jgi:subtilisin
MSYWSWKKLWILLFIVPFLTACPPQARLSLPSQAVQGGSVTASLVGLNGEGARVTVAGLGATVTTATRDSITFVIPDNAPEGSQEVVILSGDQRATGTITIVAKQPGNQTFVLDRKKAARGETVTATTTGIDLANATLNVAGKDVPKEVKENGTFTFKVPDDAPAGPQTVVLRAKEGELPQLLGVLGDVVPDKLSLLLKVDVSESVLGDRVTKLGFTLERFRVLGGADGPCASALADIDVGGKPLGQALEDLEKEDVALQIDPRTSWAHGSVDHLSAISASVAHNNLYTGAGSTIAVLDTGVSQHSELTGRLVFPFNAIDGSADVTDGFDDPNQPATNEGHGTPIAVLAAGSRSGVAPEANIMPVKTCNDQGECFSSDVIVGMCHALTAAKDNLDNLILNLSFGGDTPVEALQAVMKYALDNGVQIAAAAGNEGEAGSPAHYPAAFNLPGLVAVGALQANSLSCLEFEAQSFDASYDITETFTDNGTAVSFAAFDYLVRGQRVTVTDGAATISDRDPANETNKDLVLVNINSRFGFNYPLDGLTLFYRDQGGAKNFSLNSSEPPVILGSLAELNGQTISGVAVFVSSFQNDLGTFGVVRLEGTITSFAIGGQEFFIDDICPKKSGAWQPAVFSTKGDYVDIAAPGEGLRSGTPANAYANAYQGTSFSTPLVAGAMALWKEADVTLTPAQIEANLKRDAIRLAFTPSDVGAGLLNLNVAPFNVPPVFLVGENLR